MRNEYGGFLFETVGYGLIPNQAFMLPRGITART